jgi:hypothetical protein
MKIKQTEGRVKRTPVNGKRNVLTVQGKDPNYEYRIVNDTGDRVALMQERGYEIVSDSTVKVGDRRVANPTQEGSPVMASVGGGTKAYLMRIKKEWYQEDQEEKARAVAETEQSMKRDAKEGMYGKLEISS